MISGDIDEGCREKKAAGKQLYCLHLYKHVIQNNITDYKHRNDYFHV